MNKEKSRLRNFIAGLIFLAPPLIGFWMSFFVSYSTDVLAFILFVYFPLAGIVAFRQRRRGNSLFCYILVLLIVSIAFAGFLYLAWLVFNPPPHD